ncbi:hypothetical protein OCL06_03640 [Alteromonas sp. ASW11-19]|uniref:Uncharacterized protein n=1 Tax=Alteromonas salexigens TaxID=2982530 RepID=A0ABT2VLG9_9ALTE|nr:hypothetical protein [Alteromonas salexigens]MCU7553688.1 hypothetical protein [Alteromonas salexigens]
MHINTNLEKKDYLNAYKDMFVFLFRHPLITAIFIVVCLTCELIPFAWFPLKMAGYALAISLMVCVTTLHYRSGSLQGLLSEWRFQGAVYLPAIALILGLSWLGFLVADTLLSVLSEGETQGALPPVQAVTVQEDGNTLFVALFAAAIVCVAQIMPLVLAHFCRGLGLSRHQGEKIWLALMLRAKSLLAFIPIAQLVPLSIAMNWNVAGVVIALATLYSTFLLFIVFNISPAQPRRSVVMDNNIAAGPAAG